MTVNSVSGIYRACHSKWGAEATGETIVMTDMIATQSSGTQGYSEGIVTLGMSYNCADCEILSEYACSAALDDGQTRACIPSIMIDTDTNLLSDMPIFVELTAQALETANGTNFASAFADPSFEIDPSFPLASEFSIALSPGIGNPVPPPPSVPEPGSLALLGVALSGFVACRRPLPRRGRPDQVRARRA
ncbi:MAG TPA: PEP-CTERM sorting domain-containing protein [Stellaceae bacterium]|nr:PEP-CTERM sorting domain-containing protein [Stellaceae bacterium]